MLTNCSRLTFRPMKKIEFTSVFEMPERKLSFGSEGFHKRNIFITRHGSCSTPSTRIFRDGSRYFWPLPTPFYLLTSLPWGMIIMLETLILDGTYTAWKQFSVRTLKNEEVGKYKLKTIWKFLLIKFRIWISGVIIDASFGYYSIIAYNMAHLSTLYRASTDKLSKKNFVDSDRRDEQKRSYFFQVKPSFCQILT